MADIARRIRENKGTLRTRCPSLMSDTGTFVLWNFRMTVGKP